MFGMASVKQTYFCNTLVADCISRFGMVKSEMCSTGSQVTTTNLGGGKCGQGIPEPAGEADRIYGFGMVKARK